MEEETQRYEAGTWVALGCFEEVCVGCVEDEGGDGGVAGCELSGERGSDAGSVGDDLLLRDGAGVGEVLPGGVGIVDHILLARVG